MNVSELTLLVLRIGFLLVIWLFVFVIVFALRSDLFGQRVRKLPADAPPPPFTAVPSGASPPAAVPRAIPQTGTAPATPARPVRPIPAAAAQPKATVLTATRLVITSGPRQGTELLLTREPLTIGRSGESGLIIRDDYTSTHHARLLLWNDQWMIQDLDSTNGTFLGGSRVTVPTQVHLDTPIKIGTTTFEFRR